MAKINLDDIPLADLEQAIKRRKRANLIQAYEDVAQYAASKYPEYNFRQIACANHRWHTGPRKRKPRVSIAVG